MSSKKCVLYWGLTEDAGKSCKKLFCKQTMNGAAHTKLQLLLLSLRCYPSEGTKLQKFAYLHCMANAIKF